MSDNWEARIAKSDIWEAVNGSGVLGSSKNQSTLFKYLLDCKYDRVDADIKTKDIASKVFGRNGDFNAKKDSIVRVEMHRLRSNLETFNQQSDSLKITLPKSSYLLQIEKIISNDVLELPSSTEEPTSKLRQKRWLWGSGLAASLAAMSLIYTGAVKEEYKGADCSVIIPNLEVANPVDDTDLSRYVMQVVSGAASQFSHFNIVQDVKSCASSKVPGYKLEFALLQSQVDFQGSLSVLSEPGGKIVGFNNFSGVSMENTSDQNLTREDLYFTIAKITNDFLKPGGVVHRDAVGRPWEEVALYDDYICLAKMYESFVSDSDNDYYQGLECLEGAYENETASLDNLGGLAASYLEQAQGNRGASGNDPIAKAKVILDEIGYKWLQSADATAAKIMFETIRTDFNSQRLRETLLQAEKAYPSHPTVLMEVSRYTGFTLGEWDSAVMIMEKAKRLMSDSDNSVYQVDAAYAVLGKAGPTAWENCLKAYSEHSRVSNLLVHSCAVKYNKPVWKTQTEENLAKFNLLKFDERKAFLDTMGFEKRLSDALLADNNLYD